MDSYSSKSHEMDTSYESFKFVESFDDVIVLYSGRTPMEDESQESTATSSPFNIIDLVKLFIPGYGEVEAGSVMEARPYDEWLGVQILKEPWLFVLLHIHLIILEA